MHDLSPSSPATPPCHCQAPAHPVVPHSVPAVTQAEAQGAVIEVELRASAQVELHTRTYSQTSQTQTQTQTQSVDEEQPPMAAACSSPPPCPSSEPCPSSRAPPPQHQCQQTQQSVVQQVIWSAPVVAPATVVPPSPSPLPPASCACPIPPCPPAPAPPAQQQQQHYTQPQQCRLSLCQDCRFQTPPGPPLTTQSSWEVAQPTQLQQALATVLILVLLLGVVGV